MTTIQTHVSRAMNMLQTLSPINLHFGKDVSTKEMMTK